MRETPTSNIPYYIAVECPQCKQTVPEEALRYLRKGYPVQCPQCMTTFVPGEKRARWRRAIRRLLFWVCFIALVFAGVCYYPALVSFWDRAMSREEIACPECSKSVPACQVCAGTGSVVCPRCRGEGDYVVTKIVTCDKCNGTGKRTVMQGSAPLDCVTCRREGTPGKVTVKEHAVCPMCEGRRRVKCTSCVPVIQCTRCSGGGKVKSEAQWRRWLHQGLQYLRR